MTFDYWRWAILVRAASAARGAAGDDDPQLAFDADRALHKAIAMALVAGSPHAEIAVALGAGDPDLKGERGLELVRFLATVPADEPEPPAAAGTD
ncbi:MAG TPA: hypothetical protein VHX88_21415 [Solirubrobacteraceae bacterium]|jgi:hypothetical protein|nr:hypothetical protein [Solirubrobacteraceae bacterium]